MSQANYDTIKDMIYKDSVSSALDKMLAFEKALTDDETSDLFINIIHKYWIDDKSNKAMEAINMLMKRKIDIDTYSEALLYKGRLYMDSEDYGSAIKEFNKAACKTKNDNLLARIYYDMSRCYYMIPKRNVSIKFAYKSIEHHKKHEETNDQDICDNIETIIHNYLLMKKLKSAKLIYDEWVGKNASKANFLSNMHGYFGDYYFEAGIWDTALSYYKLAYDMCDTTRQSTRGKYLLFMGDCYSKVGQVEKALEAYKNSLQLLQEDKDDELFQYAYERIHKNRPK